MPLPGPSSRKRLEDETSALLNQADGLVTSRVTMLDGRPSFLQQFEALIRQVIHPEMIAFRERFAKNKEWFDISGRPYLCGGPCPGIQMRFRIPSFHGSKWEAYVSFEAELDKNFVVAEVCGKSEKLPCEQITRELVRRNLAAGFVDILNRADADSLRG